MIVGLMRMAAGTGAEPHSHPNEQWIYVLGGLFRATSDGRQIDAKPGPVLRSRSTQCMPAKPRGR